MKNEGILHYLLVSLTACTLSCGFRAPSGKACKNMPEFKHMSTVARHVLKYFVFLTPQYLCKIILKYILYI